MWVFKTSATSTPTKKLIFSRVRASMNFDIIIQKPRKIKGLGGLQQSLHEPHHEQHHFMSGECLEIVFPGRICSRFIQLTHDNLIFRKFASVCDQQCEVQPTPIPPDADCPYAISTSSVTRILSDNTFPPTRSECKFSPAIPENCTARYGSDFSRIQRSWPSKRSNQPGRKSRLFFGVPRNHFHDRDCAMGRAASAISLSRAGTGSNGYRCRKSISGRSRM